jgi:predicted transcriptional regulator
MNVLLSIKPKYVEEIIKGDKKYEFRKSIFRCSEDVNMIYIYSSSPVKKIVGMFTIETIVEDHPKKLWKNFSKFSGIGKDEFFDYFGTSKKGFAIEIGNLEAFANPIDPFQKFPDFNPPQSFYYLDEKGYLQFV